MQLFSIGLWQLNIDGTQKLVNGEPVPTYTQADVEGLSRVLTGFAWARQPANWSSGMNPPDYLDLVSMTSPMKAAPAYHEPGEKKFLGVTIPASSKADPTGDLKIMLDTLYNHPNVGPFIGRQMIQRMVTSNPSAAYVARVAKTFNDNGKGVRGDMAAVVRAILADEEARSLAKAAEPTYGRIREPILRFAHIQRLLNATDGDGVGFHHPLDWEDPLRGIAQQPFRPPNVFGFSRPNYAPPGSELGQQGLVAPEMQLVSETSVYGWYDYAAKFLDGGGFADCCSDAKRLTYWLKLDFSEWMLLSRSVPRMVDRLDLLLTGRQMSKATKDAIIGHVYAQDGAHLAYGWSGLKWPMARLRVIRAFHAAFVATDYVVQR